MPRKVTKIKKEGSWKWLIWPSLAFLCLTGLLSRTTPDSAGPRSERPEYARKMPRGGQLAMNWLEPAGTWRLTVTDVQGAKSQLELGEFSSEDAVSLFYRVAGKCPGGPVTPEETQEMLVYAEQLSHTLPANRPGWRTWEHRR